MNVKVDLEEFSERVSLVDFYDAIARKVEKECKI